MYSPKPHEQEIAFWLLSADQGRIFRKVTEGLGSGAAAFIGIMFIIKGADLRADIYQPMLTFARAEFWGIVMLMLACARLMVLIVNGWWPHSHTARKILSIGFLFFAWLPLTACWWWSFFHSVSHGTPKLVPGMAYSLFTLSIEFMILYAHSTYIYAVKRRVE